jgi:hypothetical protein
MSAPAATRKAPGQPSQSISLPKSGQAEAIPSTAAKVTHPLAEETCRAGIQLEIARAHAGCRGVVKTPITPRTTTNPTRRFAAPTRPYPSAPVIAPNNADPNPITKSIILGPSRSMHQPPRIIPAV